MPVVCPPHGTGNVDSLRDGLRRGRLAVVFLDVSREGNPAEPRWMTRVVVEEGGRLVGVVSNEALETRLAGETDPAGPPVAPTLEWNRDLPAAPIGTAIRGMTVDRLVFGVLPDGGTVLELEVHGETGRRTLIFTGVGELCVSGFPSCSCHRTPVILDVRSWRWDGFTVGVWAEACGSGGLRFFARGVKEGPAE